MKMRTTVKVRLQRGADTKPYQARVYQGGRIGDDLLKDSRAMTREQAKIMTEHILREKYGELPIEWLTHDI